jgi:LuxR family maltose regulon positive regulatory protein
LNPLLSTKFFIPPKQTNLISRPRLVEKLNAAFLRKLTLISAPAGFGKTTLVSDWLSECQHPVLWLSLDKDDSDPKRFLLYFITALQKASEKIGATSFGMLQHLNALPSEALSTTLVNEIATVREPFVLVLDDFHFVDSKAVDETLTFLFDHLPPQMHLLITTREDPSLPLARLRVKGQLNEIRAADLRFTHAEAADFLNRFLGSELSEENIAALEERTEGWIAGLQLAALSLQGNQNPEAFIQSFTGSHHFVLDYLIEEVLEQQAEDVQTFLLSTSILERFNASLCDALLPDSSVSGQEALAHLENANLFLVPLDHERRWYRYHKLFADLLQQRLLQENIDIVLLHAHASQWYEENGFDREAFEHAVAANDVERAHHLLRSGDVPLHFRGAMQPVLSWLASLPAATMDAKPALWVTYASVLTIAGKPLAETQKVLLSAENAIQPLPANAENKDLLGQLATIRAMLGIPLNQIDETIAEAEKALALLGENNLADRTTAAWALGYAYQLQGKFESAVRAHRNALETSQKSGNLMISIATLISLGQIAEQEYDLQAAENHYTQVLALAGEPPLPPAGEAYLGLARIYYEWNQLDAALENAEKSLPLALQMDNVDTPLNGELVLAKIQFARQKADVATAHLRNAEDFAEREYLAHKKGDVVDAKVALLVAQGDLENAANLAQTGSPFSRAKVALAQGDASAALALPDTETKLAPMLLKIGALYKLGEKDEALALLNAMLKQTSKGGLLRSYVDSGTDLANLLPDAYVDGVYLAALKQAFGAAPPLTTGGLIDPLSERELEILQLIAQGLSNREIAARLYLALDTVKGHNRKLFNKLQVQRRTEAVARARTLGLL